MMFAKINRLGFILCIIYLLITAFLLWSAYSASGDFKGQFVLMQLPIVLPLMLLDAIGFKDLNLSWLLSYLLFIPFMLFVLYYLGVGITKFWCYSKASVVTLIILLCLAVWFWDLLLNTFYYQ